MTQANFPYLQRWSVFGLEEDAADASDSLHVISGVRWWYEEWLFSGHINRTAIEPRRVVVRILAQLLDAAGSNRCEGPPATFAAAKEGGPDTAP